MSAAGRRVFTADGLEVRLGALIKSGGAGSVYHVADAPAQVAKLYHPHVDRAYYAGKITAMLAMSPKLPALQLGDEHVVQLAWPQAALHDPDGAFLGFLMPTIDFAATSELECVLQERQARALDLPTGLGAKVTLAANLATVLAELHRQRHYMVDLKPVNLRFYRHSLYLALLDCDGFSIQGDGERYTAQQVTPDYLAPEFHVRGLTGPGEPAQDRFALAVVVFQLLNFGIHPFTGRPRSEGVPTDIPGRIAGRWYGYGLFPHAELEASPASGHAAMPGELRELFDRAFDGPGDQRPSANTWSELLRGYAQRTTRLMVVCASDASHQHFTGQPCAACARTQMLADVQRAAASIPKRSSIAKGVPRELRKAAPKPAKPAPAAAKPVATKVKPTAKGAAPAPAPGLPGTPSANYAAVLAAAQARAAQATVPPAPVPVPTKQQLWQQQQQRHAARTGGRPGAFVPPVSMPRKWPHSFKQATRPWVFILVGSIWLANAIAYYAGWLDPDSPQTVAADSTAPWPATADWSTVRWRLPDAPERESFRSEMERIAGAVARSDAKVYAQQMRIVRASAYARRAIPATREADATGRDPYDSRASYLQGREMLRQGNLPSAEQAFIEAVWAEPDNADAWMAYGLLRTVTQKELYGGAIAVALLLEPNAERGRLRRIEATNELGPELGLTPVGVESALAAAEAQVRLMPALPAEASVASHVAGETVARDVRAATTKLQKAKLDEVAIYAALGDRPSFERELDRLRAAARAGDPAPGASTGSSRPDRSMHAYNMGEAALQSYNAVSAQRHFIEALRLDPDNVGAWKMYGLMQADTSTASGAIAVSMLLEHDPANALERPEDKRRQLPYVLHVSRRDAGLLFSKADQMVKRLRAQSPRPDPTGASTPR
jgi:tetratricopeptide (TPR) repeat protein